MYINPYLNFEGQCEAAFRYYAEVLGGRLELMETWGNSPMCDEIPPEWHDKVLHTLLKVKDTVLMGSDAPPGYCGPASRDGKPQGITVSLTVSTAEEAERIFAALADQGQITIPMEKTFWAERFGGLIDRFQVPWMVSTEAPVE